MSERLHPSKTDPRVALEFSIDLRQPTVEARFLDPEGTRVAVLGTDDLFLIGGGGVSGRCDTESLETTALAVDAQTSRIALGGLAGEVWLLDGNLRRIATHKGPRETAQLAFSREGLLAIASGSSVTVVDLDGRERFAQRLTSTAEAVAFSTTDELLAAACSGRVDCWRVSDGGHARTMVTRAPTVALSFSPDDHRLACVVAFPGNPAVQVFTLAKGTPHQLGGFARKPRSLAWSKDGRLLATSGGRGLLLWTVSAPCVEPIQFGARGATTSHVVSGASLFATGGSEGVLAFWSPGESDEAIASYQFEHPMVSVAFSSDGARVLGADAEGNLGIFRILA